MSFYGGNDGILGWYNETKTGGVGTVSKIHWTENGETALCGAKPGRNAVMIDLGSEFCAKCEAKKYKNADLDGE